MLLIGTYMQTRSLGLEPTPDDDMWSLPPTGSVDVRYEMMDMVKHGKAA